LLFFFNLLLLVNNFQKKKRTVLVIHFALFESIVCLLDRNRDQIIASTDDITASCHVAGSVPCPYHSQSSLLPPGRFTRALTGSRQCLGDPVSLQRVALLPGMQHCGHSD
jgi:hypothetical protein